MSETTAVSSTTKERRSERLADMVERAQELSYRKHSAEQHGAPSDLASLLDQNGRVSDGLDGYLLDSRAVGRSLAEQRDYMLRAVCLYAATTPSS